MGKPEEMNREDLSTDRRIIWECILGKDGGKLRTGLIWLRIGTSDGLLWTRQWTFGFHKRHGIAWLAEWLTASQHGLWSMQLVKNSSLGRTQWPWYLRGVWSWTARTLGPWVRIPQEAWVSAFFWVVLSSVVRGHARGRFPTQGFLPKCLNNSSSSWKNT